MNDGSTMRLLNSSIASYENAFSAVETAMRREWSKKPSSKATAMFARGAYWSYVSTGKWRERGERIWGDER